MPPTRRTARLAPLALPVALLLGCQRPAATTSNPPASAPASAPIAKAVARPPQPPPARTGPPPSTLPTGALAAVTEGNRDFATDLYARIAAGHADNVFFSPYSASAALAMAYAGAGGGTAKEMAAALHFGVDPNALPTAFAALEKALVADGNSGKNKMNIADALWIDKTLPLAPDFADVLAKSYGAAPTEEDFHGDPESARGAINDWVSKKTEGKIEDLIPQGAIDPDTSVILTNAIYFKGPWLTAFDPSQSDHSDFTLAPKSRVKVPTMHQLGQYALAHEKGYRVLELPYDRGTVAMDVYLPSADDGLSALDKAMTGKALDRAVADLSPTDVDLSLPTLHVESTFSLKDALKAMGMPTAFVEGAADFSGISTNKDLDIWIQDVLQKAVLDVDEKGTTAAAATAVLIGATDTSSMDEPPPPEPFHVDHPFALVLRDTENGAILFMGRVTDPR